jgi:hypothetical protein
MQTGALRRCPTDRKVLRLRAAGAQHKGAIKPARHFAQDYSLTFDGGFIFDDSLAFYAA